jgi:hypothetical protein
VITRRDLIKARFLYTLKIISRDGPGQSPEKGIMGVVVENH